MRVYSLSLSFFFSSLTYNNVVSRIIKFARLVRGESHSTALVHITSLSLSLSFSPKKRYTHNNRRKCRLVFSASPVLYTRYNKPLSSILCFLFLVTRRLGPPVRKQKFRRRASTHCQSVAPPFSQPTTLLVSMTTTRLSSIGKNLLSFPIKSAPL